MYFVNYKRVDGTVVTLELDSEYEMIEVLEELEYEGLEIINHS